MASRGPKKRKLNSDQLGEKGESRFRELCADAQLTCNKSDRDRTGWDFIVEFPFESAPASATLDKRNAPISCHFQQKTVWDSSGAIKIRLSSAERIAKELKPAFIYVLNVDDKLEFVNAFLIHMLGDPLRAILARLRTEEAKGTGAKINDKFISLHPTKYGQQLEPTGQALRAAISALCGSNPHHYVEIKKTQLKELGFEPFAYTTQMKIHLDSENDLADLFLGLKREVRISDVVTFETRFEIELPAQPSFLSGGKLTLEPQPADRCVVTYRRRGLHPAAVFDGTMLFAPPAVTESGKAAALFRTDFFYMRYADSRIKFETHPGIFSTLRCSVQQWRNFFEMGLGLAAGEGEFQIKPHAAPTSLILPITNPDFGGVQPGFCTFFIETSASLERILKLAGLSQEFPLIFEEIRANARQIRTVDRMLRGQIPKADALKFSSTMPAEDVQLPSSIPVAYVNFLSLAGATIGYAMKADMAPTRSGETLEWSSKHIAPIDLRLLDDPSASFQRYARQMQTSMGVDGL